MRRHIQTLIVIGIATAGMLAGAGTAVAEPSFGSDAAFPVAGIGPNTVLEPGPGSPIFGPLAPPPATVLPSLLTPPLPLGGGEVDDISYGDEMPIVAPISIEFSVGPAAFGAPSMGHPGAPPPPPLAFDVRMEAGLVGLPPFGDGAVNSDIYMNFPAPIFGPPPCGPIGMNQQILDGDGAPGAPFGPPRLAIGMPEPGSNVDAYERTDSALVTAIPGAPLIDAPVFFTIDGPTAAGWPGGPIPAPGGGAAIPAPGDIMAWNPAVGGPVIWAFAAMLGLLPGDDVDALAVTYASGIPLPPFGPGFAGAPDLILFSLAVGSPSLAFTSAGAGASPLASMCFGAATGTAGDLWFVLGPVVVGGAIPYMDAEMLGLNTVRTGGGSDDNIDAIDICNGMTGTDIDGDLIDGACDPDIDGDGIGNGIDLSNDGDAFTDVQQTLHLGPANTDLTKDNCPLVGNPAQLNTDGNFIDNSPPLAPPASKDDKTWPSSDALGDDCDPDDDNDGISDVDEASGAACGGSPTNPLLSDSDTDRFLDNAECLMGTNPNLATSKPTVATCAAFIGVGVAVDTDADKVKDYVEFCNYNTDRLVTDTDGDMALDGARDGCEASSLNGDRVVNSGDQLLMVQEFIREPTPSLRLISYDINKDGAVNVGDQLIIVGFFTPSGQCP
jgi:hypothetical protein